MFGCKEVSNIRRQGAAEYADYLFQHKVIIEQFNGGGGVTIHQIHITHT